jgi:hypothetical protein
MAEKLMATEEETLVLGEVLKALRQVNHGYVQLILQDSKVIQIDKMEKVRFRAACRQSCTCETMT